MLDFLSTEVKTKFGVEVEIDEDLCSIAFFITIW